VGDLSDQRCGRWAVDRVVGRVVDRVVDRVVERYEKEFANIVSFCVSVTFDRGIEIYCQPALRRPMLTGIEDSIE